MVTKISISQPLPLKLLALHDFLIYFNTTHTSLIIPTSIPKYLTILIFMSFEIWRYCLEHLCPRLTEIECHKFVQPVNTRMQLPVITAYNSVLTVSCLYGYWFRPGVHRVALRCTDTGEWSEHLIACQRKCFQRLGGLVAC